MSGWLGIDAQGWSAIAGIGALMTALVNFGQGKIAARTNTAQIYFEFSRRYNEREISDAITALVSWYKTDPTDFAQIFAEELKQGYARAAEINIQRRTLNRYFIDIVRAYEAGVLDIKFTKLAANQRGASVWRHIVVPMNKAHYPNSKSRALQTLLAILPKFGEDKIV